MREFTPAQADRHNALVRKGWALVEGRLILQGKEPKGPPSWFSRLQLNRAIWCFDKALTINPEGWSSMWALGKIYQRLGDQESALRWLLRAHTIHPDQLDVAREASLAALDLGRREQALKLCEHAVKLMPQDPGLVCNLALAHCLAGNDGEAIRHVNEAALRDPSDPVTAIVKHFITQVAAGELKRPKDLREVFPY